jgi:hypothetical protein
VNKPKQEILTRGTNNSPPEAQQSFSCNDAFQDHCMGVWLLHLHQQGQ